MPYEILVGLSQKKFKIYQNSVIHLWHIEMYVCVISLELINHCSNFNPNQILFLKAKREIANQNLPFKNALKY